MDSFVQLINEVGFPIAAALGLGLFIWKLINRIIDGMETKVDVLDEKVAIKYQRWNNALVPNLILNTVFS